MYVVTHSLTQDFQHAWRVHSMVVCLYIYVLSLNEAFPLFYLCVQHVCYVSCRLQLLAVSAASLV